MNRESTHQTTPELILRELLDIAGSQPMLDHAIEKARAQSMVSPPDIGEIIKILLGLRQEFLKASTSQREV